MAATSVHNFRTFIVSARSSCFKFSTFLVRFMLSWHFFSFAPLSGSKIYLDNYIACPKNVHTIVLYQLAKAYINSASPLDLSLSRAIATLCSDKLQYLWTKAWKAFKKSVHIFRKPTVMKKYVQFTGHTHQYNITYLPITMKFHQSTHPSNLSMVFGTIIIHILFTKPLAS